MSLVNILSYLPSKLSVLVYLIPAEMKDAYMSLEMRQLNVECINTRRLKEAQDDNQKISVMRYVAGAMTYKVNKMPDTSKGRCKN